MKSASSDRYVLRNSVVDASASVRSAAVLPGSRRVDAQVRFMSGELQKARMLRRWVCAIAVPILPGEAPITPEGFPVNEFFPCGRLAQSIAFLSPPGIERLYSGVTNSTASRAASVSL